MHWVGWAACEQTDEGCDPVVLCRSPVHRAGSSHDRLPLVCFCLNMIVCVLHFVVCDAVQLSGLAARVHRALIGPFGAACPEPFWRRDSVFRYPRCDCGVGFIGIALRRFFGIADACGRYPG